MSPQLERLMRTSHNLPKQKRILELNPKHDVVGKLHERFAKDGDDPGIKDGADLLLGYALLAEGSELHDPARFNSLLVEVMGRAL
jgi:molecular chaperone HtpG